MEVGFMYVVPSTYLVHLVMSVDKVGITFLSKYTMKIPSITGDPKVTSLQLLHYRLHWSCFISFPSVHTSLMMFHFYLPSSTVHLIHSIYHSPSRSYLPYLVVFILHGHSTSLSLSLFSQFHLWKLTTYEYL